jgi:hypothetical protein
VRSGNSTEGNPIWQMAAGINYAAPELAHIQGFSARMFAGNRAPARPNAPHKQHTRAVVVFQVIDIGLEARGISNTNASTRTRL